MASVDEQETTVTGYRKGLDSGYLIWTADPVHIRALDKRVATGQIELRDRGEDWASYSVDPDAYDPVRGFKRAKPVLSAEEVARRTERLRGTRNS